MQFARRYWFDALWLLVFGGLSSLWCLTAALELGATFDEPGYILAGLQFWREGSHAMLMRFGTMPLPIDLTTLPVYIWERTHGTTYTPQDLQHVLGLARSGTLVFWWVLLIYAMLTGTKLAGPWAGRLAVALLASQPSLLAHAALATTDIAISAALLAFLYHFRAGRECVWWKRVGLAGLLFGIALCTKASAVAFAPICMVVIELDRLARSTRLAVSRSPWSSGIKNLWQQSRPLRRDGLQIGLLGLGIMVLYCGSDWQPLPSFGRWANNLAEGTTREWMVWLSNNLAIFHNGIEALVRQVGHNARGHGVYILGQTDPRCLWYYFPVALTMKLTAPFLLLPVAIAFVKPKALTNWACLCAAALLLYSLNCRVQIGVRLMLPLVTLAGVGLAAAVAETVQMLHARWKVHATRAIAGAGLAWSAAACLFVWPHGLCYVNEIWGGTASGYQRLSDSNYDWGQGLVELERWQRDNKIDNLDIWYFGTDPRLDALPMRRVALHSTSIQTWDDLEPVVRGRHVAVSTTLLYGAYSKSKAAELLRPLPARHRTQTFIIYDFTKLPLGTLAERSDDRGAR